MLYKLKLTFYAHWSFCWHLNYISFLDIKSCMPKWVTETINTKPIKIQLKTNVASNEILMAYSPPPPPIRT